MPSGIRIRKWDDSFELAVSCGALEGFDTLRRKIRPEVSPQT